MPSRQHLRKPMLVMDPPSPPKVHRARPFLTAEDLCVGCIVWLPDVMETSYVRPLGLNGRALNIEGYYHPVVILGITPQPMPSDISEIEICFAILTTFRGVTLLQYEITKESLRPSIPIVDSPNPGDSQYLHLENRRKLRKQSYVRLESVYETSITNLRSYAPDIDVPAYDLRLDKESYQRLMALLSLDAQDYPPTTALESARKIRNSTRIPISIPGPGTAQTAPYNPALTPTRDARHAHCTAVPTATQTLHELPHEPQAPEEPAWNPISRQNRAGPAPQPYGDMFVDLESRVPPGLPSAPYMTYETVTQLPAPTMHRSQWRRRIFYCCEGEFAVALVFCFFLFWILVAYAGWLVWRALRA